MKLKWSNLLGFAILSIGSVTCTLSNASTPALPTTIRDSFREFSQFVNLWDYSVKTDSNLSQREDIEPKTLLLPGDASMARLVPQDAFHPLFLEGSKYSDLRQEFILDHLVLDPLPVEGADDGIIAPTLSGKMVFINRDATGKLTVNGVPVKKTFSIAGTYYIYILKEPLFNQTMKVRQAFSEIHNIPSDDPVGPPLDIPEGPFPPPIPTGPSVIRAPAPPPRIAKPPAPPKDPFSLPSSKFPLSSDPDPLLS